MLCNHNLKKQTEQNWLATYYEIVILPLTDNLAPVFFIHLEASCVFIA